MRFLGRIFGRKKAVPVEPFRDEVLGTFTFDPELGWKKTIALDTGPVELVLGSDGSPPVPAMIAMARAWVAEWSERHAALTVYLAEQTKKWVEMNGVDAKRFTAESINLLWEDQPETSMIYFDDPDDDTLLWHITCRRFEPVGLGCDD